MDFTAARRLRPTTHMHGSNWNGFVTLFNSAYLISSDVIKLRPTAFKTFVTRTMHLGLLHKASYAGMHHIAPHVLGAMLFCVIVSSCNACCAILVVKLESRNKLVIHVVSTISNEA